jgi:hypothetical protein
MTLMEASLELFSMAHSKEALVVDHMQFLNETCQSNVTFIKQCMIGR